MWSSLTALMAYRIIRILISTIGLKKKLAAIAVKKPYAELSQWIKSITNHLYWCVHTTEANTEYRRDKWLSVYNHISNVHVHEGAYAACEHGDLSNECDEDGEPTRRTWISKGRYTKHLI